MSLLDQLQKKRDSLQKTHTIVTTITGDRYVEAKSSTEQHIKLNERCHGFIVDNKPDIVPACIIDDFLYLGSQDAVTMENIKKYALTHILSVDIESPLPSLTVSEPTISTQFVPCLDLPDTNLFASGGIVSQCSEFIESAIRTGSENAHILVHCNAGVSRSASVIIAYLMEHRGFTFDDAYQHLKTKRPCVQPNAGFLQQLKQYTPNQSVRNCT